MGTERSTRIWEDPGMLTAGERSMPFRRFRLRLEAGASAPTELTGGAERLVIGSSPDAHFVLRDDAVSPMHCEIRPENGSFLLRDLGSKTGTWLAGARVREVVFATQARFRVGSCEIVFDATELRPNIEHAPPARLGRLLGTSPAMRAVIARLSKVAERDTGLLLEGESGTGKELAANGVHLVSPRRDGPFVVVDCGSIPRTLIEPELFGHERGAYTGASQARDGTPRLP